MRARLHPRARADVLNLLQTTGHSLTPDDWGVLTRLNDLAERLSNPTDPAERAVLQLPTYVGDVCLRQPSLGKLKWYEDYAGRWWTGNDALQDMAIGYVCSVENTEEALHGLTDQSTAEKTILRWWRHLKAPPDDYMHALARVLPTPEHVDGDNDHENQYGPTIALLVREYGNSADYWMYEAPWSLAKAMLQDYNARIENEYAAWRKANTHKARQLGQKAAPAVAPPAGPKLHAHRRYRLFKNAIQQRWAA